MWRWTGAIATAAVTGLLLYWRSTQSGFCFDDHLAIVANRDVIEWGNTSTEALWHDFWGRDMNAENSHKSWRPLTILSFKLNHMAVGLEPAQYHATNAVLHGIVSGLVVQLGRVMTDGDLPLSMLAGVIFAVHPVHVEAVAGIVGRADELCTMLCILAFLAYVQLLRCCSAVGPQDTVCVAGIIAWSVAFFCLAWAAFLSKEVAVTVLGIVAAYDLSCQPWRRAWLPLPTTRSRYKGGDACWIPLLALALRWSLLLVCGLWYLSVRHLLTADSGKPTLEGSGLLRRAENPFALLHGTDRLRSMLYLQAYYGWLLLWPEQLCCEYSYNCIPALLSWSDPRNMATMAFWVGLGIVFVKCVASHTMVWDAARRQQRPPSASPDRDQPTNGDVTHDVMQGGDPACVQGGFALGSFCWLTLPMVPATNLFFVTGTLIAERLLYMPSVGYSLLLAAITTWFIYEDDGRASSISGSLRRQRRFSRSATVVAPLLMCGFAVAVQRTLVRQADWDDDMVLYKSAVHICPDSAKNHFQLGQLHANADNLTEAWYHYRRTVEIDPEFCDVDLTLGQLLLRECKDAVLEGTRNGGQVVSPSSPWLFDSSKRPRDPMAPSSLSHCPGIGLAIGHLRKNVDCIFTSMKSFPWLVQVLEMLIEEQPTNATLYEKMAELMVHAGRKMEGAAHYSSQGQAAKRSGDFKAAAKAFAQASKLMPSRCEYNFWRGEALHSQWEARYDGSSTKGKSGIKLLSSACVEVLDAIKCVNKAQDNNEGRPYSAVLGTGQLTALTAGNFVPTLVQWYQQIIGLLSPAGPASMDDDDILRRGKVYENMAVAIGFLSAKEALAGGVDRNAVMASYLLHAAGDHVAAGASRAAYAQLRRIDEITRAGERGCPLAAQFVNVGLLLLHKVSIDADTDQHDLKFVANSLLDWAPRARKCDELSKNADAQLAQLAAMR